MQLDLHAAERSPRLKTLADYRRAIEDEVSNVALRVGLLLRQAKASHPGTYTRWVERELPFGVDTARRMVAISEAYETLPESTLAGLPKPWQALYALRHIPKDQLALGVSQGSIQPGMSVLDAQHYARTGEAQRPRLHPAMVAAGALMHFSVDDLSPDVLSALRVWLVGPLAVDEPGADPAAAAEMERG